MIPLAYDLWLAWKHRRYGIAYRPERIWPWRIEQREQWLDITYDPSVEHVVPDIQWAEPEVEVEEAKTVTLERHPSKLAALIQLDKVKTQAQATIALKKLAGEDKRIRDWICHDCDGTGDHAFSMCPCGTCSGEGSSSGPIKVEKADQRLEAFKSSKPVLVDVSQRVEELTGTVEFLNPKYDPVTKTWLHVARHGNHQAQHVTSHRESDKVTRINLYKQLMDAGIHSRDETRQASALPWTIGSEFNDTWAL